MLKRASLLLAPDSAPGIDATTEADSGMEAVLEKLGLPADLRGEEKPQETEKEQGVEDEKETPEEVTEETPEDAATPEPEFTPEQQAWLDARRQSAEAEAATLREEKDAASKRLEELEAQLEAATAQPLAVAPLHPAFLADSERDIAKLEKEFAAFEKWALAHWDGVDEVEAEGKTPAQPGYTAQQVRARYGELKEMREKVIPAARDALAQRAQFDAAAKERYPDLFNPKHADYRVAEAVLTRAPGLKAIFPNIKIFIGDALRGERARLAEEKAKAAKGKPAPAPKAPVRPAPGGRSVVTPKAKTGGDISAARFMELGGDRNALVQMIAASEFSN